MKPIIDIILLIKTIKKEARGVMSYDKEESRNGLNI